MATDVLTDHQIVVLKEMMTDANGLHGDPAAAYSRLGAWMADYGPEIVAEIERLLPMMRESEKIVSIGGAAVELYHAVDATPGSIEAPFALTRRLVRLYDRVGQLTTGEAERLVALAATGNATG